tara:strand:+ start:538 stop:648 length:111 start_codon:yes stop_codon:yes gene_type:complete
LSLLRAGAGGYFLKANERRGRATNKVVSGKLLRRLA